MSVRLGAWPARWARTLLVAALGGASAAAVAAGAPVAEAPYGGALWLRPNPDLFHQLGLRAEKLPARGEWSLPLRAIEPVSVELGDGAPTRLTQGALDVTGLRLRRADGARSPALRLVPDPSERLGWQLIDAQGAIWLRISGGMRSPDRERDGLRLITADLRVGPALARWTEPAAAERLLANAALQLPLAPLPGPARARAKSCAAPNWPGTPGYVTDVRLTDMDRIDVLRCRRLSGSGSCDGPGGVPGELVIVPSARLSNRTEADAADVPWYTKFSGDFAPYGNDQHPFLVWNMYRLDGEGRIEQIARSGLKHAFATANEFCQDATCPINGHILGRGCQDLYNAGSNDFAFFLSARSEVIASRGQWGRCGSVYDDGLDAAGNGTPGCDGVQDPAPTDDGYRHRLVPLEDDIAASLHPGATWLIDAWYLVREDVDIYNTMGSRSVAPQYANPFWNPGFVGPFQVGPVIDRWLEQAPADALWQRVDVDTPEGQVGIAVRVQRLPDQRYRYDYAVMNFDFGRAVIDPNTTEPNLRLLRNLGLGALVLDLANGAVADSNEMRDGDANLGNDWVLQTNPDSLRWSAPAGATQDWGQLRFLRVISSSAPSMGQLALEVAEPGAPSEYAATLWVPDGAVVFRDGYE